MPLCTVRNHQEDEVDDVPDHGAGNDAGDCLEGIAERTRIIETYFQ